MFYIAKYNKGQATNKQKLFIKLKTNYLHNGMWWKNKTSEGNRTSFGVEKLICVYMLLFELVMFSFIFKGFKLFDIVIENIVSTVCAKKCILHK